MVEHKDWRLETYLLRAQEAEEKASKSKDETARVTWEVIAQSYRDLAVFRARVKWPG